MGAWSSDKIYCVHFSRVGVSYFQPCLQVYLEQSDFFQFWEDFEVLFRLVVFSGLGFQTVLGGVQYAELLQFGALCMPFTGYIFAFYLSYVFFTAEWAAKFISFCISCNELNSAK